jgi:hypothetical protein
MMISFVRYASLRISSRRWWDISGISHWTAIFTRPTTFCTNHIWRMLNK